MFAQNQSMRKSHDESVTGRRGRLQDIVAVEIDVVFPYADCFLFSSKKRIEDSWVEMFSATVDEDLQTAIDWKRFLVRSCGAQCIKNICHGNNSAFDWNRIAGQAFGVP